MTRPTKHPRTGIYRVRKAVPTPLRSVVGKREWEISLNTRDPIEAKLSAPAALARIGALHRAATAASQPPRTMTQREVMEVAGEWYLGFVADWEDDPGTRETWEMMEELGLDQIDQGGSEADPGPARLSLTKRDLTEASGMFAERGVPADAASVKRLAEALWKLRIGAAQLMQQRADGDYSPDPTTGTLPSPKEARKAVTPLTDTALLAAWAAERNPAPATLRSYGGKFRQLVRILGFNDLKQVGTDEVVRFKQARLAEGTDPSTVEDDIRNMGGVCRWGVKNRQLPSNPFEGMAPKAGRQGRPGRQPFTDDDARRVLGAARRETGLLRWLPWLLCFTGARISELVELRRGDVRQDVGVWVFDLRPNSARQGKNATFQRLLPLHPAIVEEGFLTYLAGLPADPSAPLFPTLSPDPKGARAGPATTQLGRWMRKAVGITDPMKVPAHSWRHRMEDELRKVMAPQEVQDAITGRNNPRNSGANYGKGFRGMPGEVLKVLRMVPSPLLPTAIG